MGTENIHTEMKQEQISQINLILVSNDGLKKLGMANVARRVGIVPSGFHRHFHNTDGVLNSILDLIPKCSGP